MNKPDIAFIAELETIVMQRLAAGGEESYTARLAAAGTKRSAQKVGEEGVELALAAAAGSQQETIDEAADLVYHRLPHHDDAEADDQSSQHTSTQRGEI